MSRTLHLYQLQTLDSDVDETQQRLDDLNAQLGESTALKQAKSSLKTAEVALRQAQTKMQDLDLELKSLTTKIESQEKQLYSGRVLSAKEASNLQEEVASLKRWQGDREEHLLEAMVEVEDAETTLNQAQANLSNIESTWNAGQQDLIQERDTLKQKLVELTQGRPRVTSSIDAQDLNVYEKLRPKRAGRAVAAVKGNVCQGCGVEIPSGQLRPARSGNEIVYCPTCGRILYVS